MPYISLQMFPRFLCFCYGQMMTIFGVREGISETSINRLSKRMPMPENNEVKTWLPAKLQRVEIVSEKMMKSRSFCLSQGCSSANQRLSGARLWGRALPGNFQEKHEKWNIRPCSNMIFFGRKNLAKSSCCSNSVYFMHSPMMAMKTDFSIYIPIVP